MKFLTNRRTVAVAGLALAAMALTACVSETPAVASRIEALNMAPPKQPTPTQPTLVWVPGHYNNDGVWVPGRWRKI